jgi:hypothetical protein
VPDFSVVVQARIDGGQRVTDAERLAAEFMGAIQPYRGVCSVDEGRWEAIVSVDASDAIDAGAVGATLVRNLAGAVGLPAWPIVRVDAIRVDLLDDEHSRPRPPDLVSGPEAAEILQVSTQRLHQLAAEHPDFPKPAYDLKAAKLWSRAAVEAFGEGWARKPGRPRRDAGKR